MTPEEVLALWERAHRTLSPTERTSFLGRAEVRDLAALPAGAIDSALATSQSAKLADIAARAAIVAWWYRGDECEPDGIAFCARCKPYPYPPVVVITRGSGEAFHASERCYWLVRGQNSVDRRGGQPASVETVALQVALGAGKLPCRACFPAP